MASSSDFDSIDDYNEYLISNDIDINVSDYVKEINSKFYNIDISFMDFFMSLVGNNDICIPHQKLIDYEVISKKNCSTRIKELIKEHDFKIKVDYRLSENREPVKQGGFTKKDEYTFTPKAFKICLMKSKNKINNKTEDEINKDKYAKYFLLLEEGIKYHKHYHIQHQLKLKQSEINKLIKLLEESNKDNKELIKENKEQTKELKESNKKLDKQSEELKEVNKELKLSNKKLDKQSEELKESNKKLDKLEEQNNKLLEELREVKQTLLISSHDRATKVSKSQLNDVLILLKNNNILNNYCSLRTQKKSIKKAIKDKGDQYTVILEFLFDPNSITHNNEVKIQLKKMRIADIYYNNIMLHEDYSEKDLKEIYLKVYEERIINMI